MERRTLVSLCAALALFLSTGVVRAADEPSASSPAAAKAGLEAAYASSDEEAMVEAIQAAAGMKDPAVVALVAKGLRTRKIAVIDAAIDALGETDDAAARKALRDAAATARTRDLSGYETVYAHLLREIGRQGDKAGIEALTAKPFNALTYEVGVARVMGLSRIRDRASIEALLELSRLAGGRGAKSGALSVDRERFRPAFRVAMSVLTGRDEGLVPADWEKWWRNHGAGFKVSPDRPPVPDDVRKAWEEYWGESYLPKGEAPPAPRLGSPITIVRNPSEEQVKAAVEGLKAAFKSKAYETIAAALGEYGGVDDKKVVHEVAAGLRSRDPATRIVSIETLGWMPEESALRQLHREFRRGRSEWPKQEDVFAALLKAIGRHGDPSSIEVLADDPFRGLTMATGTARIFGLANIRRLDAVDELVKGTQLAGSSRPRSGRAVGEARFRKEFYAALMVLTGEDLGADLESWRQWWRKSKGTFKVPKDRPPVPDWVSSWWTSYWGEPYAAPKVETQR